jgi:hypothetical protein
LSAQPDNPTSVREALTPAALRAALVPRRPVFGNPWDSTVDMFACYVAVSFIDPLLLWGGGEITSSIFGFGSHWSLGLFMVAAFVGAAGFMTIVGRERTRVAVDVVAIAAWLILGLVVAPVIGLGFSTGVAIACYAVLLLVILVYVLRFGHWETEFIRTASWPVTWSLMAVLFAFVGYRLIFFA